MGRRYPDQQDQAPRERSDSATQRKARGPRPELRRDDRAKLLTDRTRGPKVWRQDLGLLQRKSYRLAEVEVTTWLEQLGGTFLTQLLSQYLGGASSPMVSGLQPPPILSRAAAPAPASNAALSASPASSVMRDTYSMPHTWRKTSFSSIPLRIAVKARRWASSSFPSTSATPA